MVVFLFGYEINLMRKKPKGQGRGRGVKMEKEVTPTEEMKMLVEIPLDISKKGPDRTASYNV